MRVRSLVAVAATLLIGLGAARTAKADPKGEIAKEIKQAMSSYDSMDYDAAKRSLQHAIETAKRGHLDSDPITAQAYLDLGIVAFANSDQGGAKEAFAAAAKINPAIQIDPAYRSDDMANLLDSVRGGGAAPSGGGGDVAAAGGDDASVDCGSVKGLQHDLIDTAPAGRAQHIEALLAPDVKAVKVSVMYRSEGKTQFSEVQLQKQGQCKYVGEIPAGAMRGSIVQYYVAAYGSNGRPVAAKGSEGSPNLMEITGTAPASVAGDDSDDPLSGGGAKPADSPGGGDTSGGSVSSSSKPVTPKPTKFMVAVSGGTGVGYVTGGTEGGNAVKACCLGNSLAVVMPEIAYFVNPRMSVGVVVRLGFPLGANYPGHATMAPGGMVRVRYALQPDGEGLHVLGQVGAGILRDTIKLDNGMPGMDTDIVAQGPLLLGGGVGFTKHIAPQIAFLADASVLAAIDIAGNDMKGNSTLTGFALNSGLAADLSLGLAVGF